MHQVLIIGSGFGGLCAAIGLERLGITDFRILERRSFMGGTWAQNHYPGAAVDVQSPLYSLSFEPHAWTQMFAAQEELQSYTEHVIAKYGLRQKTELGAEVRRIEWDEVRSSWRVVTRDRGAFEARFVINASGPLSTPVIPRFPGRDTFEGPSFHTGDWRHDIALKGKRVAIIGSGASAAQVIPAIASEVGHLHVFQRTPHWVLPRPDHVFTPLERRLLANRTAHRLLRTAIYCQLETRVLGFKYSKTLLNQFARKKALAHLRARVPDPELRRKLTPDFTIGCKRIILSNTLYPALCRPNVSVHDRTQGIAEITQRGVRTASGVELELDAIIYATGYDATDGVISYPVIGRGGQSIADFWREFPRAYLGTTLPGFPNLFIVTGPNTGIGHASALFIIESQMNYIMQSIRSAREQGALSVEVLPAAEAVYTTMVHREMQRTVWQSGGCQSWYKSKSGHVVAMFPGFSFTYRRLSQRFKREDHRFLMRAAGATDAA
ncbi:MAG: NAD(P)/FAD-dependent oxidoreductase [Myxococcales bacterium]